jgi:hypothetical protein
LVVRFRSALIISIPTGTIRGIPCFIEMDRGSWVSPSQYDNKPALMLWRRSGLVVQCEWIDGHPALQKGARLQALEAKHTYRTLVKWHTEKTKYILHREILDGAKDKIQEATGLRPTNEKLLKGIRKVGVPSRVKDHMRTMLTGKIKCGTYWNKIPGYNGRAICPFCKKKRNIETTETEEHLWLECNNSGQKQAWKMA